MCTALVRCADMHPSVKYADMHRAGKGNIG